MTFLELINKSYNGNHSKDAFNQSLLVNLFTNDNNGNSTELSLDPQSIGIGVLLAVFILFAIVGNILVILSVICNRHLQTVTNYFIINLAIADLLLSIIVLPFSASLEVLRFWVFGRIFCNIWAAVDVLCCSASIMSLCVISIDRYIGVKYSLKYPTIMTEKKAVVILIVVWVSSMVISIGPLLGWKEPPPSDASVCSITEEPGYALFSSLFSFYLPLMVILVMYFRIYVVARRTTKSLEAGVKRERNKSKEVVLRIHCRSVLEEAAASSKNKNHPFRSSLSVRLLKFSREKKAAKTLAIVVGVFILCWFPFFFVLPFGSFFPALKPSEMVFKVIFWLGYFNSCVNPIIYPCSSKEFKRAFIRLLKCQCQRRKRPLWRFYDQRWRTSANGSGQGSYGDIKPRFSPNDSFSLNNSFMYNNKRRTLSLHGWKLFPPFQKSPFQLKEKMNNLSNKIKMGPSKSSVPSLSKAEIESVSMGICSDFAEQNDYQMNDLSDCYGLRETDI
ncbi:alpha-1D adrenergic receptor-like [Acipenser oxyrinchus oxyrinchus]|uniref:Alpha-1D adrenergic receptor-like n=1 Tax=Acipenser oxyrinchus oxyrinchus TaxID=40147 RepID=A0AAD8GIC9_ACIOX|nr:alpha-1D adrenergic receptor-like [Acipenser oxyrinchus oxyrinchus]